MQGATPAATSDPAAEIARIIERALALWPGLDRKALARTGGEPDRIARLVTRRTALPEASIIAMLRSER
jgi:hypothetical protein